MSLLLAPYAEQIKKWPQRGQHILAQFDDKSLVVYQAYCSSIGRFCVEHRRFGGDFNYSRMSWIKTSFLWMMYRSNWGRSEGQEVVLAIRLSRRFFDSILQKAVASSYAQSGYSSRSEWQAAVKRSEVRLQWDPDHQPNGETCVRRALQLGLRGKTLEAYGQAEIIEITDVSDFVADQRGRLADLTIGGLVMPLENVYVPSSVEVAGAIGLDKYEIAVHATQTYH